MSSGVNSSPVKALLLLPHLSPVECKQRVVWQAVEEGMTPVLRECVEKQSASHHPHTPASRCATVTQPGVPRKSTPQEPLPDSSFGFPLQSVLLFSVSGTFGGDVEK